MKKSEVNHIIININIGLPKARSACNGNWKHDFTLELCDTENTLFSAAFLELLH